LYERVPWRGDRADRISYTKRRADRYDILDGKQRKTYMEREREHINEPGRLKGFEGGCWNE